MAKSFRKRIYIGSINERDCEIFREIKEFCELYYNIKIVDLLDKNTFSVKYSKKRLKKYPISLIILKVFSRKSNSMIYQFLHAHAPQIPLLNSITAVKACESRRETFDLINTYLESVNVPRFYSTMEAALNAIHNHEKIIVKLDVHNAEEIKKEDRILGIASTKREFLNLIKPYHFKEVFCQQYLGEFEIIYKVYVIDKWIVSVTSTNRLHDIMDFTPLELIHMRVSVDENFKHQILKIGKVLGMPIFGIDYVIKDNIPYILDINDFPSFRKIPEAVSLISDYIYNLVTQKEYKMLSKSIMGAF